MAINNNPLENDSRLEGLLSEVHQLKTKKAYNAWRKSFIKIYTVDLDPNGIMNGEDNNARLLEQLHILTESITAVEALIQNNNHVRRSDSLHGRRSESILAASSQTNTNRRILSLRGRRMLTDLCEDVKAAEQRVNEYMPKTDADEERFGYDKFELAAVLLKDGFLGFDRMKQTSESLERIQNKLCVREDGDQPSHNTNDDDESGSGNGSGSGSGSGSGADASAVEAFVDGNFKKVLQNYSNAVESFVHVMEDLGMLAVMKQCVEVVFHGTERIKHKTTTTTTRTTEEDEEQQLDNGTECEETLSCDDYSIGSDMDHQHRDWDENHAGVNSNDDARQETNGVSKKKSKKKKKKKKEKKVKSASLSTSSSAKKKKKGKGKTKRKSKAKKESDKRTRDSSRKSSSSSLSSSYSCHSSHSDIDDFSFTEFKRALNDEDEKDDEEDPPEQGEGGGEVQCLFYFDPKTEMVGKINIDECGAKSRLLIDESKPGDEAYQNVVKETEEKQQVIMLLKKLEKKRPVEVSWLDEIKKEKAAKKGGEDKKKKKRSSKSTQLISKRSSKTEDATKPESTSSNSNGGYFNPLAAGPPSGGPPSVSTLDKKKKKKKNKKKSTVEDYQGTYKKTAAKPDSSGWTKMAMQ